MPSTEMVNIVNLNFSPAMTTLSGVATSTQLEDSSTRLSKKTCEETIAQKQSRIKVRFENKVKAFFTEVKTSALQFNIPFFKFLGWKIFLRSLTKIRLEQIFESLVDP